MNAQSEEEMEAVIQNIRQAETNKDFGSAAILCSGLIQRRPQDNSLYLWLGWIYFNDGRFQSAIACALTFLENGEENKVDGLKLLAFSAGRSGSWGHAKHAFSLLNDISIDESISIAKDTLSTYWHYIHLKIKNGDYEGAVTAYENVPDVVRNLEAADRYDMDLIAAQAYAMLGKSYVAMKCLASEHRTYVGNTKVIPQRPFDGVTFVTSLMPARHELQQRAVASWNYIGAKVVSLNAKHEIDLLKDKYPAVTFIMAPRDASSSFAKPYVYISDMLSAIADDRNDVVGIINSDIIIRST
ncbi:hypothetical protein, partial [Methylobacterium sp. WL7]|uniref:tetratricopeptide repeat protein n=1 Tax=Methylobacterium sp. WL7 TaxID=2603900 RepID=UPI0011D9DA3C